MQRGSDDPDERRLRGWIEAEREQRLSRGGGGTLKLLEWQSATPLHLHFGPD